MKKNSKFIYAFMVCCLSLFLLSCERSEIPQNTEDSQQAEGTGLYHHSVQGGTFETISYRGQQITAQKIDGQYIIGGDMIVTPDKPGPAAKGAGHKNKLWPSNTIPFAVDKNLNHKYLIYDAIKHIQKKTNIRFVYRTNQSAYIRIKKISGSCGGVSHLGYRGKKKVTTVNLAIGKDCLNQGIIVHEILHAIGMIHEHQRPDRHRYIKINRANYKGSNKRFKSNFDAYSWNQIKYGSYDFKSIMHYGSYVYSSPKRPVMTKLDGSTFQHSSDIRWNLSKGSILSKGDIQTINRLYPKKTKFRGRIPKWKVIGFRPAARGKKLVSHRFEEKEKKNKWLEGKTIAYANFGRNKTIRDWERFYVRPAGGNRVKLRIDNFGDKNYFLKVKNNRLTVVKGFRNGSAFEWITRGGKKFALKISGQNRYVQANHDKDKPELKIVYRTHPLAWETFEYILAPGFNK